MGVGATRAAGSRRRKSWRGRGPRQVVPSVPLTPPQILGFLLNWPGLGETARGPGKGNSWKVVRAEQ